MSASSTAAANKERLEVLARRLGIAYVTDVRIPPGGIGRRNMLLTQHHQQPSPQSGTSPETSTGRNSSRTNTSSSSPYSSTSTSDTTPERGTLLTDGSPTPGLLDVTGVSDDTGTSSFLSTVEGAGGNSERGALHKALALSRQDNRALRAQIERMRAREMEIVTLGVQSQMQMSSATQQLEGLKKRVRQELCHPVDETTYQELNGRSDNELDLFDTIRVSVYQQLGELQASRDRAVNDLRDNAAKYKDAEEFSRKARYEMDQLLRQHEHEVATLQDRIEILEQRCKGLEQAAKTASLSLDANESKAARFDALEAELKRSAAACAGATEEKERLAQKCSHLGSDLNQTRDELQRQSLLLNNAQTELKFQTREAERSNARLADRENELRRVTEQLDEIRRSRATSGTLIGAEREELRASYEKQLEAATRRMKEGFETDLSRVREMSKEASERECSLLREARDSASSEVSRMRQQYAVLESDYNTLKEQTREKLDNYEREIFELRIEVANRTNDGRRHDLASQESTSEIQRLRTDRDCLQKKLDVLKQEFYDTRAAYQQQVTALQSKLEAQESQLEMFKSLETEAEVFMQHLAQASSASEASEVAGIRALMDVPSSRRAAHTISVTKRCLALENQVSLLKHEQGLAELKHQKLVEELERARAALQDTNSPYLLLEKAIEQRDQEIGRLRDRVKISEEELSAAMRRAQLLAQDVQVLTTHRAEVLRLRDALRGMTSPISPTSLNATGGVGGVVDSHPSKYSKTNKSSNRNNNNNAINNTSSSRRSSKVAAVGDDKENENDDDNDDQQQQQVLLAAAFDEQQEQNSRPAPADGFYEFHF